MYIVHCEKCEQRGYCQENNENKKTNEELQNTCPLGIGTTIEHCKQNRCECLICCEINEEK